MIACCNQCYSKYIDKSGVVDQARFNMALAKHIQYLKDNNRKIPENGIDTRVCKCDCHRDDVNMRH